MRKMINVKGKMQRTALLLSAVMLFAISGSSVRAAGAKNLVHAVEVKGLDPVHAAGVKDSACAAEAGDLSCAAVAGLCEHHTEHTAECMEETPCTHAHTQDCYSRVKSCIHVHTQSCYSGNGAYGKCTHACSRASGCIQSVLNCHHEHSESCTYAEGSVCGYSCGTCHESSGQEAPAQRSGGHHSERERRSTHHSGHH